MEGREEERAGRQDRALEEAEDVHVLYIQWRRESYLCFLRRRWESLPESEDSQTDLKPVSPLQENVGNAPDCRMKKGCAGRSSRDFQPHNAMAAALDAICASPPLPAEHNARLRAACRPLRPSPTEIWALFQNIIIHMLLRDYQFGRDVAIYTTDTLLWCICNAKF